MKWHCLVCGYDLSDLSHDRKWTETNIEATSEVLDNEICPCCGIQYGLDDVVRGNNEARKFFYLGWRGKWIRDGKQFSHTSKSLGLPPKSWDPTEQLKNILKEFK